MLPVFLDKYLNGIAGVDCSSFSKCIYILAELGVTCVHSANMTKDLDGAVKTITTNSIQ